MSNNPDNPSQVLSPEAAYTGIAIIAIGVVLSVVLPLLPQSVNSSSFLLFVASAIPLVSGFITLTSKMRMASPMRYSTIAVAILLGMFLLACLVLAVGGWSDTVRTSGEELGLAISQILFFTLSGGVDDLLLNAIKGWKRVVMGVWLGNIVVITAIVLAWTMGHLQDGDAILSAAFVVAYASSTKYFSLCLSAQGQLAKKIQITLGIAICPTAGLGCLYLVGLINPELPSWIHSSALYATAVAFGVSYIVDGFMRREPVKLEAPIEERREEVPMRQFYITMALQGLFMILVGIVGALLPSGAPLLVGLTAMESIPNFPVVIAMISEMKGRQGWGWIYGYNKAFSWFLGALILLCTGAIWFQSYIVLAGGITITFLQCAPWMQAGHWACITWARRPARALALFITVVIVASLLCVGLAFWITRFGFSQTDLVAIWYSAARGPSAIGLLPLGFLGVALMRGEDVPRVWRYLLWISSVAIGAGFMWFTWALLVNRTMGALVAPGLLLSITGSANVLIVYGTFSGLTFKRLANAAIADRQRQ